MQIILVLLMFNGLMMSIVIIIRIRIIMIMIMITVIIIIIPLVETILSKFTSPKYRNKLTSYLPYYFSLSCYASS